MTPHRHLAAGAVALLATACGESSVITTPTPAPTPQRPLQACNTGSLTEPGFVADTTHSGTLDPGRYSLNGDVEGAMMVFGFETGERGVFSTVPVRPLPSTAPGAASSPSASEPPPTPTPAPPLTTAHPGTGPDVLIICDVLRFGQADGGKKFIQAFKQFRLDSHQQQVTAPALGDRSVAFMDTNQAFAGYAVDNANGAEIAVGRGPLFWSVSVFGPHPTLDTAVTILQSMMRANG